MASGEIKIEAKAVVFGMGGKAAHATIGEGELAKVIGVAGSCVTHAESIAKQYYLFKTLVYTYWTQIILVFEWFARFHQQHPDLVLHLHHLPDQQVAIT